jgi:hypothetical protein
LLLPAKAGSPLPQKVALAGRELKFAVRQKDASLWGIELEGDLQVRAGETLSAG